MLVISIPFAELCLHLKIEEDVNGRAISLIVVVERWTSFYRIHDRQNVLAPDTSENGTRSSMIEK